MGGAERQAMQMALSLHRRSWRVTMVALSGSGGASAGELRAAGVEFLSLEMRKGLADPRGWLRFHRWLKRERPDVVHAHLPHAAWMARWSRIAAHVPVVIDTIHSSSTGTVGRQLGYALSRWLPDQVTAVSQAAAASHLAAGMVSEKKLAVLANGIDVDDWRADQKARDEVRLEFNVRGEFLWLSVGRLDPVKDFPALMAAMAQLPGTARLVILGEGPMRSELLQLAERIGVSRRVDFRGFESNVKRWLQSADGFVLTSRYEGLPMVLLEAGACGVPAVATDVAGTREVLVHGETGWLARAGDASALAAEMMRLMAMTPAERRGMGERARTRVVEHFSLDAILDQWEELYCGLPERNANRRIRLSTRSALTHSSATQA